MYKMMPYVNWVREKGFVLRDSYDPVANIATRGGNLALFPHQVDILGHCLTQGDEGQFPYTTVVYSAPKKDGKTTVSASVGGYFAEEGPPDSEIYCIANDLKQAQSRVYQDIQYHATHGRGIPSTKYEMVFPNGCMVQALALEHKSEAGARQALTLWDELWGFMTESARGMWAEMTPISTVPISLRWVSSYAGIVGKSTLLEELYKQIVVDGEPVPELEHIRDAEGKPVCFRKGRMFAYWDTKPRMPWQTAEYYLEQMNTLRPADYLRLHENRWVTQHETFIPMEMWEACETLTAPLTIDQKNPKHSFPITVGVDVGIRHDCSAVVGVYYDVKAAKVGQAFHMIWTPREDEPLDLEETVERYLLEMSQKFTIANVAYDEAHFHRSMTTLAKKGLHLTKFTQSVRNMQLASQTLYDLLKTKRLEVYRDDEMRNHIRFATAEEKGTGFRIMKDRHSNHKIDYAVALAMACYDAIERGGVDVSKPMRIEMPFSDISMMRQTKTYPDWLPEALRT